MSLGVSPNLKCCQISLFTPLNKPSHSIHHSPFPLFHRENLRTQRLNRAYSVILKRFPTANPDILEPSELGINPEPPSWPERNEMLRLTMEMKLSRQGLPFSIRIIKKMFQSEQSLEKTSLDDDDDFSSQCSAKKAFSSMIFIFYELQHYAAKTSNCKTLKNRDLRDDMHVFYSEMNASFGLLFQHVFCKTPSFMLYIMVLLTNFSASTVYSMYDHAVGSAIKEDQKRDLREQRYDMNYLLELYMNSIVPKCPTLREEMRKANLIEKPHKRNENQITESHYLKMLRKDDSSLILSNYAQFCYTVLRQPQKAEVYFRLSVEKEPADAEVYSRYGDFLWMENNDVAGAEMMYRQAIELDKYNTHHTSKYAVFLWNTGA